MDLPSVVNSTWDSGAILSKSRMGRSMITAQLVPMFNQILDHGPVPALPFRRVTNAHTSLPFSSLKSRDCGFHQTCIGTNASRLSQRSCGD